MYKFQNSIVRQYAVVLAASASVVNLGMSVVWTSPMTVKLRNENQTILTRPITLREEAWIVSIVNIVGLFVIFLPGFLMDYFGRKLTLLLVFIPRISFCMFTIFATEVWMIFAGRIVSAIADVITLAVIPTYISEIASKEIRGALGSSSQILSAIGMMIMFGVGPFVSYLTMNVLMLCLTVALTVPQLFIPESPYFLYSKGNQDRAIEVLTYLRGSKTRAQDEAKEYSSNTTESKINKLSLLKNKTILKTFAIITYLSFGLQMIGYNAVNIYLQSIFETTQTSISPEVSSLVIGCIQLIACLITVLTTDRFGRKPILCVSLLGIALGMIGLGVYFVLLEGGTPIEGFLNFVPLVSVAFVIYGFNAGMGSLLWPLIAELLDSRVRPYGITYGLLITLALNFTITNLFPTLLANGASYIYWIFAFFCVSTAVFIATLVPETKGKSFNDIQKSLGRKSIVKVQA